MMGFLVPSKEQQHHNVCVKKILSSDLLLEEDYDYIIFLQAESGQTPIQSRQTRGSFFQPFTQSLLHISVVAVSVLFGVLNFSHLFFLLFTLFGILYIMLIAIGKIRQRRRNVRVISVFHEYIHSSQKYQAIIKKCLRFIKEMEIAAMGYTLISGNTPVNRFRKSRQKFAKECLQLRHEMLKSVVKITILHRNTALQMLENEHENTELKFSLSLCHIPIEELGPCFDSNLEFDDLVMLTDNFCLEILRDAVQFMFAQRSEILKILSLIFSTAKGHNGDAVNHFFKHLQVSTEAECSNVTRVLKAHENVQSDVFRGNKDRSFGDKVIKTPLFMSVHSIQVHLRAALQIALESEESLGDENNLDYLKEYLLPQLKVHLDASDHCVNESIKHLHPQPTETSEAVKPGRPGAEKVSKLEDSPPDNSLLDPKELFSEDQVFEAVSVAKDFDVPTEEISNDNDVIRKKRIQETKHVMKELKSVLHVKTSVEEREIRKSKLFPNYIPKQVHSQASVTISEAGLENNAKDVLDPNAHHSNHHEDDLLGEGDVDATHALLRQPRRPPPPGRARRKSKNKIRTQNADKIRGFVPDCNEELSDGKRDSRLGAIPMGLGFSSQLASQAASVALLAKVSVGGTAVGIVGEEATFGDSDSAD